MSETMRRLQTFPTRAEAERWAEHLSERWFDSEVRAERIPGVGWIITREAEEIDGREAPRVAQRRDGKWEGYGYEKDSVQTHEGPGENDL